VGQQAILTGCQLCVNSDRLCRWERAIFDPYRIDTPQSITKKIVTGDYVSDPYGCAILAAYPCTGDFWAHGWNITKIICIYAHLGGQKPKKKQFWGVNRRFQAKLAKSKTAYYQNYCIDSKQIFHSDKDHQMPFVGGPLYMHYNSKMADDRHLGEIEKSLYLGRGSSDLDEIWHAVAVWPSWPFWPLKIWNFENPRWRRPSSWQIEK